VDGLATRALTALDGLTTAEGWPLASAPASGDEPVGRFAALFGRDALITSLQVLPARPAMATATLAALAGRRGRQVDPETGEEPGKILHEERELAPDWMLAAGYPVRPDRSSRWYWPVDATPLFLVLAAMAGVGGPAVTEALGWLERALELWAGLLRPGRVEGAVAALDRLLTPWGLRTVGQDHARFDPSAYHYGAVWPFENWFAWGGRGVGAGGRLGRPTPVCCPPGGRPAR
jgi:glycogen debranching enzyme